MVFVRPIIAAAAAAAIALSGCSGTGATPQTARSTASVQAALPLNPPNPPPACTSKVYVADYARNDVEIYPQGVNNPAPCGKITTGISAPEGIYADAKGRLYVANYLSSSVTEYARGKRTPSLTIPTAAPPYDLFVGSDGTLYVAEATQNAVAEYARGKTTPYQTLSINGGPHGVATDNSNNLYVSYLSNSDGVSHVEKFAPRATVGTDLGFTVGFAGEVKLDTANDVVIGDRNADTLYVFPPGQTTPSRSFSIAGAPVNFALDQAEASIYVAGLGQVQIFNFQTGTQTGSIAKGLTSPSGVALYPPAPY